MVKGSSHSCEILLLHRCLSPKLIVLQILHLSRRPLSTYPALPEPKLLLIDARCSGYLPLTDQDSRRLALLRELIEVSGGGVPGGLGAPRHDPPLLRRLFICGRLLWGRWNVLFFLFLLYFEVYMGLYLIRSGLDGWDLGQLIVVVVTVPKLFQPGVIIYRLLLQGVVFLLILKFFVYFLSYHIICWTLLLRFFFVMSFFIIISCTFFIDLWYHLLGDLINNFLVAL